MSKANQDIVELLKGRKGTISREGKDVTYTIVDIEFKNNRFMGTYALEYPNGARIQTTGQIPAKGELKKADIVKDHGPAKGKEAREELDKNSPNLEKAIASMLEDVVTKNDPARGKSPSKSPGKTPVLEPHDSFPSTKDRLQEYLKGDDGASSSRSSKVKDKGASSSKKVDPLEYIEIEAAREAIDDKSILPTSVKSRKKLREGTPFGTIKSTSDPAKVQMQINAFIDGKLKPSEKLEINLRSSKALEKLQEAKTERAKEAALEAYASEIRNIGKDILDKVAKTTKRKAEASEGRAGVVSRGDLLKIISMKK